MKVHAIFGPPGTGKTRSLVDLVGKAMALPGAGAALFLSFTRAAAAEAVSRLTASQRLTASTIHSMAFNGLGMTRAAVVDTKKLSEFGRLAGFPFKGSEYGSDEPQEGDEYAQVVAFANNQRIDYEVAYERLSRPGTHHRFQLFVKSYLDWKKSNGYCDFDDMLIRFLSSSHQPRPFDFVFLDEAQDCSPLHWAAFSKVCAGARAVYIAGDDDQAIYEWNGANPHGMVEFTAEHGGKTRILNQSHRVPRLVHVLAHNIILNGIEKRVSKKFQPTGAVGMIKRYGEIWNIDPHAFNDKDGGLILVRDNWRLEEVKRWLNREMIPYNVFGGSSPWTSKIAQALKRGEKPEIPAGWRTFYDHADLSAPIYINLSTVHQAKGREAKRVIFDLEMSAKVLVNLYKARDAELRVQYVACTRTSDELHLCGSNPLL